LHRVIVFYICIFIIGLAYNSLELGELSDIIVGELDGVQVCVLDQVLQFIATQVVVVQLDL